MSHTSGNITPDGACLVDITNRQSVSGFDLIASIQYRHYRRDPDADCEGFTQGPLFLGEIANCETDGHFLCGYCKFRNQGNVMTPENRCCGTCRWWEATR